MSEVGIEIVKTEEAEKNKIKYLNINVSNSEVERKPDIVRLCADAGILEYVKPSSNVISRQAVDILVDELARAISDERCCISRGRSTATIMQDILDLPPVNPQEPKTGHWYYDEEREATGIYAICSNCDEKIYQTGDFKYCPNCGARMESEDKE